MINKLQLIIKLFCMRNAVFIIGIILLQFVHLNVINAQIIRTVAGIHAAGYTGDGGLAVSAEMNTTNGVATDTKGNFYFSDVVNHTVRKVTINGTISTYAGIPGHMGFTGDGGPAINALLFMPSGLAIDNIGNLYIADNGNSVIRKVDTTGKISTVAGTGSWGFSGDGGAAIHAKINGGFAVVIDRNNNLLIADGNTRIRKVNTSGIITTIAGTGAYGYSGDGGYATSAAMAGTQGIAVDTFNNIYVSESGNNIIRKISTSGIITTFAGNHFSGYNGDHIQATSAKVNGPRGIAVDKKTNNIIFADQYNNRIRQIDSTGIITTIAGFGISGSYGDGGRPTNAMVSTPTDVKFNNNGNLFIADAGNYEIREILYPNTHVTLSTSDTICTGTSVTFSMSTLNTYYNTNFQWRLNGTNVSTDTTYTSSSLLNGDVVNCLVFDTHSGFVIDSGNQTVMIVNQYITPSITITPTPGDTVCHGTTVLYTSAFYNAGTAPTIKWLVNSTVIHIGDSLSYIPTNGDSIKTDIRSNARCILVDTALSNSIHMMVKPTIIPTISITSTLGDTICNGTSVIYNASFTNGGLAPRFKWFIDTTVIDTGSTYIFIPSNGDSVKCNILSNATCVTPDSIASNKIRMTVNPFVVPSVTATLSPDTIITAGATDTLTANVVNGGNSPLYQWTVNRINVPGETNSIFITTALSRGDTVLCKITSNATCILDTYAISNYFVVAPGVYANQISNISGYVSIVPNPNNGDFTLIGSVNNFENKEINYVITDIVGQKVIEGKTDVQNGKFKTHINLQNNIPNGIYLFRINMPDFNYGQKFVIKR